jgi:tetratricopeptide (TPR) repeat protein
MRIREVPIGETPRIKVGIAEFDRLVGGGIVPGSLSLVGGDPGIGKSTLLGMIARNAVADVNVISLIGERGREVREFLQNDLLGQADIANQSSRAERNPKITVRELLDRAAEQIEGKFRGQPRTEASIRLTIGQAYLSLGEFSEAQKQLDRSLAWRREKLGADHPETLETANDLARLYYWRGQFGEAETLFKSSNGEDGRPPHHDNADYDEVILYFRGPGAWGAIDTPGVLTWVPKGTTHWGATEEVPEGYRAWLLECADTLRLTKAADRVAELMETGLYGPQR